MKRIVICTDGTWNKPDQKDRGKRKPSNVVKIARGVLSQTTDGTHQVVYYDEGIGTQWGLDKYIGGGFGVGLSNNILQAYQFLVYNYHENDELFFFGFSRGAYTVRSLAGFIDLIGLLPKNNAFFQPEGYALYRNRAAAEDVSKFKEKNECREIKIKFIGVWDTVGALGIPGGILQSFIKNRYEFHDVNLAYCVENAYHALAIDERRKPFKPSLWSNMGTSNATLEQAWFSGVHTNIGGGYENDGLANIPLHWLKNKAKLHGLEFDEKFLGYYRPYYKDELRDSYTGIYRLMGPYVRPIGKVADGNETVDVSAIERMNDVEGYKPNNLRDYLDRKK